MTGRFVLFLALLLVVLLASRGPAAAFHLAAAPRVRSGPALERQLRHDGLPALAAAPSSSSSSSSSASDEPTYFEWLGRQIELKLRPKPYTGLRLQVDKDFAVLLMRSSYQVVDDLDFVPMNGFQQSFFFVRQAEWEDYRDAYPPLTVKQGFLTDPAYLDFISFAQYATINQEMRQGKLVFVEQINAEGDKQVVKRDPRLEDNALLPKEHSRRVGDRILERLLEAPEVYRPTVGPAADLGFEGLLEGVRRIEDYFVAQRFNNGATVAPLSLGPGKRGFQIVSRAPANFFGLQNLLFRKDALLNDYEAKAVLAFLRACGVDEARVSYKIEPRPDRGEIAYTFTIAAAGGSV